MFAKLNPDLATWGDVLNKYQHVTQRKEAKEKTNDEESITQLFKGKHRANMQQKAWFDISGKSGPKTALLAKLRDMMRRVANEQQHFLNGADHISPLFTEMRGETGTSILPWEKKLFNKRRNCSQKNKRKLRNQSGSCQEWKTWSVSGTFWVVCVSLQKGVKWGPHCTFVSVWPGKKNLTDKKES